MDRRGGTFLAVEIVSSLGSPGSQPGAGLEQTPMESSAMNTKCVLGAGEEGGPLSRGGTLRTVLEGEILARSGGEWAPSAGRPSSGKMGLGKGDFWQGPAGWISPLTISKSVTRKEY